MDKDYCCIKHCRGEVGIFYYGKPLCDKCWTKLSEKSVEQLKKLLEIKEKHDS